MPLFKIERESKRQAEQEAAAALDPYLVPEHLASHYQEQRISEEERLAFLRNPVRQTPIHRHARGPGDPLSQLEEMTLESWTHMVKLERAQAAYNAKQEQARIAELFAPCPLCDSSVPTGALATVRHTDPPIRVCHGCLPVVQNEADRRHYGQRLGQLLDAPATSP